MTTLREATLADVEALVAMGERFLASVYAQKIHANADALRTFATALINGESSIIFVAQRGGRVVGMMGLLAYVHPMSNEPTVTEVMWWVDPEQRGPGLQLFRLGESWAAQRGATVVQMIAPSPEVERFYTRVGYEPVERTYQRRLA